VVSLQAGGGDRYTVTKFMLESAREVDNIEALSLDELIRTVRQPKRTRS
jgi:hypothetical protein